MTLKYLEKEIGTIKKINSLINLNIYRVIKYSFFKDILFFYETE